MLSGIKILVAEDNKLNQKIINFMLHKHGGEVAIASNGQEAISLLQEHKFDIVLMDLQMPEMDGQTATRYIRQTLQVTTPIIAVTASTLTAEAEECMAIGMNAYVSKPLDAAMLCQLILKVTNEHKMLLGKKPI